MTTTAMEVAMGTMARAAAGTELASLRVCESCSGGVFLCSVSVPRPSLPSLPSLFFGSASRAVVPSRAWGDVVHGVRGRNAKARLALVCALVIDAPLTTHVRSRAAFPLLTTPAIPSPPRTPLDLSTSANRILTPSALVCSLAPPASIIRQVTLYASRALEPATRTRSASVNPAPPRWVRRKTSARPTKSRRFSGRARPCPSSS